MGCIALLCTLNGFSPFLFLLLQRNKGTKEQRNKGTKEQRNKGTKEQRNKGTNKQIIN